MSLPGLLSEALCIGNSISRPLRLRRLHLWLVRAKMKKPSKNDLTCGALGHFIGLAGASWDYQTRDCHRGPFSAVLQKPHPSWTVRARQYDLRSRYSALRGWSLSSTSSEICRNSPGTFVRRRRPKKRAHRRFPCDQPPSHSPTRHHPGLRPPILATPDHLAAPPRPRWSSNGRGRRRRAPGRRRGIDA